MEFFKRCRLQRQNFLSAVGYSAKKTDFKQSKNSKFQKTFEGQTSEHRSNPNQLFLT
jgi:hypothetical protein